MERKATVRIWLAAEWLPLRTAFLDALPSLHSIHGPQVAVVSETADVSAPVGRVVNWVASGLEDGGTSVDRVEIGDSFALGSAPAVGVTELLLDPDPAQVEQLYALGIWSRFVPRRRRWLMRISPYLAEEIVANAARANPVLSIQIGEWKGLRLLIAAADPVAADAVGRAVRSAAQPAGDIGQSPWQADLVRIAGERRLGAATGRDIDLAVELAGRIPSPLVTEVRMLAERVRQRLDCALIFSPEAI